MANSSKKTAQGQNHLAQTAIHPAPNPPTPPQVSEASPPPPPPPPQAAQPVYVPRPGVHRPEGTGTLLGIAVIAALIGGGLYVYDHRNEYPALSRWHTPDADGSGTGTQNTWGSGALTHTPTTGPETSLDKLNARMAMLEQNQARMSTGMANGMSSPQGVLPGQPGGVTQGSTLMPNDAMMNLSNRLAAMENAMAERSGNGRAATATDSSLASVSQGLSSVESSIGAVNTLNGLPPAGGINTGGSVMNGQNTLPQAGGVYAGGPAMNGQGMMVGSPVAGSVHQLASALAELQRKLSDGEPFAGELAILMQAAPGMPGADVLLPYAQTGVPTNAALTASLRQFSSGLPSTRTELAPPPDGTLSGNVQSSIGGLVTVRDRDGADWRTLALRAAEQAGMGHMNQAVALLSVPGATPPPEVAQWLANIEARAAVQDAQARLTLALLRQISAASPNR